MKRLIVAVAALAVAATTLAADGACLKKALIREKLTPETVRELKEAGFPGVELSGIDVSVEEARAARRLAEENGLRIHSVLAGWFAFNAPGKLESELERAEKAVRVTSAYGSGVMLIVPSDFWRSTAKIPPWKDIRPVFDPKTLELKSVVDGDNAPYAEYIALQNEATRCAIRAIEALLPVAAEEDVTLAIENVGNRYWLAPEFMLALARHFRSPWVRIYFDLGNHLYIARPEHWLDVMAPEIVKLHIKDEGHDASRPTGYRQVPIGKGLLDFKSIRRKLDEIGYHGWVSIESEGWTDTEHSAIMDRFFAGTL